MKKTFNFYCLACKEPFDSDVYEHGFYNYKKGGRRASYVKAYHVCGAPNYRILSRKEHYELMDERQEV